MTGITTRPSLGYHMRFVLKAVFWFTLVALLLPKDPANEIGQKTAEFATTQRIAETNARLSAFCRDHPEPCRQAAQALAGVDGEKAAQIALDLLLQGDRPTPVPVPVPVNRP